MSCFFCFSMILFLLVALPLLMLSHRRLNLLRKSHVFATLLLLSVAAGDVVWISLSHRMNNIGMAPESHIGQLPCSRGPLWDQTRFLWNLSICILEKLHGLRLLSLSKQPDQFWLFLFHIYFSWDKNKNKQTKPTTLNCMHDAGLIQG